MAIIPDIPDPLLDVHHHWHSPSSHTGAGAGRSHAAGTPGGGVEFLHFHRNFVGMFHAWYDTHSFSAPPFNNAAQKVSLVTPWTDVPAELQADSEWGLWSADVTRLNSGTPDFATEDDLGAFIELGVHNNFVHGAAASAYSEPIVGTFHSPQSTYFYGIHGLVDRWWSQWKMRHKRHMKEIIKEVMIEVNFKEVRDVGVKRIEPELHKRIDDVKTFGLEAFEDPAKWLVDPPAVAAVRERLDRVERQVFKNALTFVPKADRPQVGRVEARTQKGPKNS